MSKGDARREADLANCEAEFAEALALALADPDNAYVSEKAGHRRGAATALDVKLFTLESKIARLREILGLPRQVIHLKAAKRSRSPAPAAPSTAWDAPPELPDAVYPLDPQEVAAWLAQSGREPSAVFTRVKCAGGRSRQSEASAFWRLATIECSPGRVPARLTLTLLPLPAGPDATAATRKLEQALERVVTWSETAMNTQSQERPRLLMINFTRATRELQLKAR